MNTDLRIIFFAHPRSGSSSLFQILNLHPDIHMLEEPFNENFTKWNPDNIDYRSRISDIPSLDAQVANIFMTFNGLKVLDYQLPRALAVHLLKSAGHKIIFLRRHNLLQSVVSVLIAEQTALWKKWEMSKPLEDYYSHLQPLDILDIQRRIRGLKENLDFYEAIVDSQPEQSRLKLVYEELYFASASDREQQIDAIWDWLGVKRLESERLQLYLRPQSAKINSAQTYRWLPNADEIQNICGNNLTGWLYE